MPALARRDMVVSIGDCFFKELMNKYLCFNTRSGPGNNIFCLSSCPLSASSKYSILATESYEL
jgi:hypothetical protein